MVAFMSRIPDERAELARRFTAVRRSTEELCRSLTPEDCVLQSMPDASPVKWHLAHTTWFFETFVLAPLGMEPYHPQYGYLFNSYYNAVGERHCRPRRGLLSRPTVEEVYRYRAHTDALMMEQLENLGQARKAELAKVIELGLHHEQQHQELILTDIKHAFAANPLRPVFREGRRERAPRGGAAALGWIGYEEGLVEIGWAGRGFAFDNEGPRHRVYQQAFSLSDRPVTAGEYLEFIRAGGYRRADLWLSDGWSAANEQGWEAPLYWEPAGGHYRIMTLAGMRDIDPAEPVCHVSYYEADAFARFAGARLPTEVEWELAAKEAEIRGNFVESGALHPVYDGLDVPASRGPRQMFGDVWEWTASGYSPYPGFKPLSGALGEYNGKFMCNQLVLRGGSCVTPVSHIRATYRNFFPAQARWQFSGIRLARDAAG